jgi:hypothetical protein
MLALPQEVRQNIWRNLFVASDPIKVRDLWTQIHPRECPKLHPAILGTCRQLWREGIRVLYGGNTFLYVVRETTPVPQQQEVIVDIPGLAFNQYGVGDQLSEAAMSDDEYVESLRPTDLSTGFGDGHINKYGRFFRRIKIVAEANRSGPEYRETMIQAIEAFVKLRSRPASLHTITIEVSPLRNHDTKTITFVDFFKRESRVVVAMKRLPTQFINIMVKTPLRTPSLFLDMRYAALIRRSKRGEHDPWAGDRVMLFTRRMNADAARMALNSLAREVQRVFETDEKLLSIRGDDGLEGCSDSDESDEPMSD